MALDLADSKAGITVTAFHKQMETFFAAEHPTECIFEGRSLY